MRPYEHSYSVILVDGFGTVLPTGLTNTPQGGTYALVGPNFRGTLPAGGTSYTITFAADQIPQGRSRPGRSP